MKISVNLLTSHPKNAEIYDLTDIEDLSDSLEEMGLLTPLVINQYNQVISGNRRLAAVKRLEWGDVEVSQVEIDDDEIVPLIIHHNKQRIKSNREILNEYHVLHEHHSKGQGYRSDLTETSVSPNRGSTRDKVSGDIGVSSGRIAQLLVVEKDRPDLIPRIDDGTVSLYAAYRYVNREKRVANTDTSLRENPPTPSEMFSFHQKSSDRMVELGDGEVDMIFTSPPYWNLRTYVKGGGLGNEETPQEYVDNLVSHLDDCKRVLSDTGSFFLNLGDTFHNQSLQNVPHRVAIRMTDDGWILRNTIIWRKKNPMPGGNRKNARKTYEFIFHFVKSMDYRYTPTPVPRKSKTGGQIVINPRSSGGFAVPNDGDLGGKNDGTNIGDYWDDEVVTTAVSSHQNQMISGYHPAPFHPEIVTLPLLQTTVEGDLVLDPFMGTGTVSEVANSLNRRFVGYDLIWYGKKTDAAD